MPVEFRQDATNLAPRQNDRQSLWPVRAYYSLDPIERTIQNMLVQEEQRGQRLVLR